MKTTALIAWCLLVSTVQAGLISINPAKDNSIFSENTNSAGADAGLFSGRTNNNSNLRRALLAFDLSSIPSGSIINSVTLRMRVSQVPQFSGNTVFNLHQLLADWGEGTSVGTGGFGGGGPGGAPTPNDATWQHRFHPSDTWTTNGGDFQAAPSAAATVLGIGNHTWSSPGLVLDVKEWVDTPSDNFGWIVLGDESADRTARRFDSRNHVTMANRPLLTVDFTPIPEPSAMLLTALIAGLLISLRHR